MQRGRHLHRLLENKRTMTMPVCLTDDFDSEIFTFSIVEPDLQSLFLITKLTTRNESESETALEGQFVAQVPIILPTFEKIRFCKESLMTMQFMTQSVNITLLPRSG